MKRRKFQLLWLVVICGYFIAVSPALSFADSGYSQRAWKNDNRGNSAKQKRENRDDYKQHRQDQARSNRQRDNQWQGTKNRPRREDNLWDRKYSDNYRQKRIQQNREHERSHKDNDPSNNDYRRDSDNRQSGRQSNRKRENTHQHSNHDRRHIPDRDHDTDKRYHDRDGGKRFKPSRQYTNVKHRHSHRPHYNIYQRKKYIYYRTPWYNTRYIAPIHYHYHPIGYRINILPRSYIRINVGGYPYFYYSGVYYRNYGGSYVVVGAPIGAVVRTLPLGFIAFTVGLSTYYYVNNTYYAWSEPEQGYMVVEKPEGAEQAVNDATSGRLFVYPNKDQDEEQQAKDRYECHRWAVNASDVDPTIEDQVYTAEEKRGYKRAIAACLEARDYTVK